MNATTLAAWVGATTGIGGLLWDFYKWRTRGPRLIVFGRADIVLRLAPPSDPHQLSIHISNIGNAPTTITNLGLALYDSWWKRLRHRCNEAFVTIPSTARPMPHKLDVGAEWIGMVMQDERVNQMLRTGNLWVEVYHSFSNRPVRVRIPRPEGTEKT